jgi:hypothetical protein
MKTFGIALGVVVLAGLIMASSVWWRQYTMVAPPIDPGFDRMTVAHTPEEAIAKVGAIQDSLTQFVAETQDMDAPQKTVLVEEFFRVQWYPVIDNAARIAIVSGDQPLVDTLIAAVDEDCKQFPDGTFSRAITPLVEQRPGAIQAALARLPASDQVGMIAQIHKLQAAWTSTTGSP